MNSIQQWQALHNPVIDELFPTARPGDKDIFDLLAASVESIRHQIVISIYPTDLGALTPQVLLLDGKRTTN